ncbi:MAG: methyltransferase domain-containing protein [Steroidobacteraceae bacterium]
MVAQQRDPNSDAWSEWLLHRRHGDNREYEEVVRGVVQRYADAVLDDAHLFPGMTLADVGTGDGLLAFRAIERIGAAIHVVLTDISAPLLRHAKTCAVDRKVEGQCTFLECSAEKLLGIGDSTIDAIVARASIAYVPDKRAAFGEFHRVLKPGGRLSIAEPILQDEAFAARALRTRVDAQAGQPADRFLTLLHRWKSAQFPDTEEAYARNPLVNFSERDLLNFVRAAGFSDIHLQLHIQVAPSLITSWEVFLDTSPHPWAPSLSAILDEQFSQEERRFFEAIVRPTVESGKNLNIERIAYVSARKPSA